MDTSVWSQFKLRVNINTNPAKAYKAWNTPAGLESWFLRQANFYKPDGRLLKKDEEIKTGDTYEWRWHGYTDEITEKGKVLAANGKDSFRFTFSLGCPVSISIYEECGETIVELVESDLPADEQTILKHYTGDSKGWLFYLTNLKSVLEGGLDLRNKKTELTNVITA
ncbi:MAG: hypothetical protein SFU87_12545, partial [Chitinophagaceae bacterium]|nr:hypothetical protein [Chitinophagaceae bacterium]